MITRRLLHIFVFSILFVTELFAQSRVVTLSRGDYGNAHIKCHGTTRASGKTSLIYLAAQDGWGLENAGDEYTFKSEINVHYSFDSGRGKILNVTDKTAVMRVTFIDGHGLKEEIQIIEVKPGCFSRILKDARTQDAVNKIECELIKLY